jgi:hypothetical protein
MAFIVDEDLLQAIASYLAKQPYAEVAGMIQKLQQCKRGEVAPTPDGTTSGDSPEEKVTSISKKNSEM